MSLTSLKSKKDLTEVFAAAPNSAWKIPDTISRATCVHSRCAVACGVGKVQNTWKSFGCGWLWATHSELGRPHANSQRKKTLLVFDFYLMALFSEEPLSKWAPPTTFTSEGAPLCHRD